MTLATIVLALLFAAPAAPPPPAMSDNEVWALALTVDSAPAYQTYLLRFPQGSRRREAVQAYYRVQGLPVLEALPEPPPRVTVTPPPAIAGPCAALLTAQAVGTVDSEEAKAYLAARRANRPAAFQAHVAKYPGGACAAEAAFAVRMRQDASRRFTPIPGFGPLAPHRLLHAIFNEEDYPARARRNGESGLVVAEWEVAEDGFAEGCRIVRSSGSALLDETSCRLVAARMRYDPARDRAGVPARAVDSQIFDWILPAD